MAFTKREFYTRDFSAGELKRRWDRVASTTVFLKLPAPCPSDDHYREVAFDFLERCCPDVRGKSVLKLDLMNEAAHTNYLQWFSERGARCYAVEISETITRYAMERTGVRSGFVNGDIRALPFAAESMDVVFSFGTMEHVRDHATVVREILRVLKPGGAALCSLCNTRSIFLNRYLWDLIDALKLSRDDNSFEASFPPYHLSQLFRAGGCSEIRIVSGGYFPRVFRCLDLWTAARKGRLFRPVNRVKGVLLQPLFWLSRGLDRSPLPQFAEVVMTVAKKPERC